MAVFFYILRMMLTVILSGTAYAETGQAPLIKKDIGELFARGDLQIAKIFLREPNDISRLESTGVIIQTKESDYVVILGDSQRIKKVRGMGFTLAEPVETDHKLRLFRVLIHNAEELIRLHAIASDVWPDHWPADIKFPLYIHGRAYDSEFKWAQKAGLNMELCHSDDCDSI